MSSSANVPDFFPSETETPDFIPLNQQTLQAHAAQQQTPEPTRPGFWSNLGSDIKGMLTNMGAPSPYPMMDLEAKQKIAQDAANLRKQQQAAGYSQFYQAVTPLARAAGVNVPGMEQSAQQGDVAGVLGHAAAVPTALAATAALTGAVRGGARLLEPGGTPAERLSAAMSRTLPKGAASLANERIAAVGDQIPSVVGGAKNMSEVAARFKARSLALDDQFSQAISPLNEHEIPQQITKLKTNLEQAGVNTDPYMASRYNTMAAKVGDLKTIGQLNDFVKGINRQPGALRGPESMVRQALTETVRDLTGQDFSGLRLEQSHWYRLSQLGNKAAIPGQLEALQSKVTSPAQDIGNALAKIPTSKAKALLTGARLFQPSQESLIRSIPQGEAPGPYQTPRNTQQYPKAGNPVTPEEFRARAGSINDRDFVNMRGTGRSVGPSIDPELARHEANMRIRAQEASQNPAQTTLFNAQPQTTDVSNVPAVTRYYDKYGRVIEE